MPASAPEDPNSIPPAPGRLIRQGQVKARSFWNNTVVGRQLLIAHGRGFRASKQKKGDRASAIRAGMSAYHLKIHNPKTIAAPTGYSHVAEVRGGKLVFIAGQVAMDSSGALVGKDDYRLQTEQVFKNIGLALESAGGRFDDLVKLTYYVLDVSRLPEIREVRDRFINTEQPPVSTAVQVSRLIRPEFLLEVDAVGSVD
jgi:2-iminobutanoate/2-iminopropanoate deaminase